MTNFKVYIVPFFRYGPRDIVRDSGVLQLQAGSTLTDLAKDVAGWMTYLNDNPRIASEIFKERDAFNHRFSWADGRFTHVHGLLACQSKPKVSLDTVRRVASGETPARKGVLRFEVKIGNYTVNKTVVATMRRSQEPSPKALWGTFYFKSTHGGLVSNGSSIVKKRIEDI